MKKKFGNIRYNGKLLNYIIFRDGTVRNIKTGHVMKPNISINGYLYVRLTVENYTRKEFFVHRLLAIAFIPNPEHKEYVHHKDRDKMNNNIDNLMWVTSKEHEIIHSNDKNHPYSKGSNHCNAILNETQVSEICELLQSGKYSQRKIAKMYNVPDYIIHEIRLGHNWKHISCNYNFDNVKGSIKYSDECVLKIADDIVNNIGSLGYIANKENVPYDIVLRIYTKRTRKKLLSEYDFSNFMYHNDNYHKDIIKAIDSMLHDGYKTKDICKRLSLEYKPSVIQVIHRRRKILKNYND